MKHSKIGSLMVTDVVSVVGQTHSSLQPAEETLLDPADEDERAAR
ncbi:hypothetical protein [Streptomyces jeddahensis]|uniref:Uncharacterized protein n=1 Tax=Streptomyces jeddahensis TaxID=1716141 RepID=A0A177HG26_9ACTN|nr:hypothetical protein [Streptomyces jeddahensis]OAH09915.1 hypothetical protein STSP_66800 [Streptomyces jeddahensis]